MLELSPTAFNATIVGVGLLLYLFAWRVTRDLPPAAKVLSRLTLAVVAIAPVVLGMFFGATVPHKEQTAAKPPGASAPVAKKAAESKPEASPPAPVAAAPPPPMAPSPPMQKAAPPVSDADGKSIAAAEQQRMQAEVLKQAQEAANSKAESAEPAQTRSLPSPAGGAPPPPSVDYDVVPVFYGTDRGAKTEPKRVSYDSERARRLELGRAMVTVPKAHEVPNIERPWAYRIPLTNIVIYQEAEDPKKHFTMQEVKSLSKDEYLRLIRERLAASERFKDHAVVFVHGFNTTFDYAVYRAAQMAYDLKFDGAPFVYSWPSKGQLGLQDYGYDRGSAEQAVPYLKEFLNLVTRETGAKTVSIIAHSMGNLALLPVLRDMKNATPPGVTISQIILAAPDVDRDLFENLANEIKGVAKGTTLYVASNDWALELSKRLAGSVARAGDVPAGGPLLLPDIDTIDVTDTSTDIFALHHSGYAEKTALLEDIRTILLTGKRPPEARVPPLQRVLS
ncbi:MAG: alpha/beta hydrolase, partial [Hyphomicrobiaceae bacterium]